ncbi:MAG TPA: hypothetical protein VFM18_12390, partial [Methanosarcina sp.]|nr:hypothetical protein [Methanosarcina sp.]
MSELTSLKNPLLFNYLRGKVSTVPLKEFIHLFENPDNDHPFLDTLKDRISLAIMKAGRYGVKDFPIRKIELSLLTIFETFEVMKDAKVPPEKKEEEVIKAAAAFK